MAATVEPVVRHRVVSVPQRTPEQAARCAGGSMVQSSQEEFTGSFNRRPGAWAERETRRVLLASTKKN